MKHVKQALGAIVIGALLAQVANAELVPSFEVGDKLFSNIEVDQLILGSGSFPETDEISVTGMQSGGNYGLAVNGPWKLNPYTVTKLWISYTVSVLPGYDDKYITGSALTADAPFVPYGSTFSISSKIYNAECEGSISKLCANQNRESSSSRFREHVKSLHVETEISVFGGCQGTEFNGFEQSFHQIPEPASMGMLAAGSVFSLVLRNKNRRRRGGKQQGKMDALQLDTIELKTEEVPNYFYSGRVRLKRPVF